MYKHSTKINPYKCTMNCTYGKHVWQWLWASKLTKAPTIQCLKRFWNLAKSETINAHWILTVNNHFALRCIQNTVLWCWQCFTIFFLSIVISWTAQKYQYVYSQILREATQSLGRNYTTKVTCLHLWYSFRGFTILSVIET